MLEYRVALLNVWWSKGENNTRFFESVEEQSTYFDKMVGGQTSPLTNFNMGNNIETAITFLDKTNKSIEELVSSNYCVIYKYENGVIVDRRYFFAYPSQDSGRQMRVLLSLDDIQTNYIKYKKLISPCNVKRACLNRFKEYENNLVIFNNNIDDKNHLFEEEEIGNLSKRVVARYKLKPNPDETSKNSIFNKWLQENILGYQYIYLDKTKKYNYKQILDGNVTDVNEILFTLSNGNIISACSLIAVPIYKTNKKIKLKMYDDDFIEISYTSLRLFQQNNNDTSYYYANKFSILPPFKINKYDNYYIDDNGDLILNVTNLGIYQSYKNNNFVTIYKETNNYFYGLFSILNQEIDEIYKNEIELDYQFIFSKFTIKNSRKEIKYNPKLLSSKYVEIRVTNGNGQSFSYNLQKIGNNKLNLRYIEALTPDITRSLFYIENGLYTKENAEAYIGLVNSFDNSLMYSNDQLQQFLAQNKNFHIQKELNREYTFIGGLFSSYFSQSPSGAISGYGSTLLDYFNQTLTLDNLENSPDMLKNANGNGIFNIMASGQDLIVEVLESLPVERDEANDYMVMYGYSYNHIDKLENVDNIRKIFNYIEADVETIDAPISNIEKERLRDILKSIRFWNTDKVDYTFENYERWLENE